MNDELNTRETIRGGSAPASLEGETPSSRAPVYRGYRSGTLFAKSLIACLMLVASSNSFAGHRILLGSYQANDLMILKSDDTVEWSMPGLKKVTDVWYLPNGNILYSHTNGISELKPDYAKGKGGEVVFTWEVPKQSELSPKKSLTAKQEVGETHSCQVVDNGKILVGVSYNGTSYVLEIDRKGGIHKKIVLENFGTRHGAFRNIRKTDKGTYLLSRIQGSKVGLEIDADGTVLREFKSGRYVLIRLPDGNTLIATTDDHRVVEVDAKGKVVWEVKEKDIPGVSLAAVAGLQRLPNGNTVIASWGGHGNLKSPAVVEVTRDKKLVWKAPDFVKNRVITVQVLDKDVLSKSALR